MRVALLVLGTGFPLCASGLSPGSLFPTARRGNSSPIVSVGVRGKRDCSAAGQRC